MIYKIIGSPGSGKTSALTKMVKEELSLSMTKSILIISFTRAAINEIKNRLSGIIEPKNIRTFHSLCYSFLGYKEGSYFSPFINDFIRKYPEYSTVDFKNKKDDQNDYYKIRDKYIHSLSKLEVNDNQILFNTHFRNWLEDNQLYDFTHLIHKVFLQQLKPGIYIEKIFIDEAQDLTPLQFELVKKWGENVRDIYYFGDPNQSIYSFSGVKYNQFVNLKVNKTIVLQNSYRVPQKVFEYAKKFIGKYDAIEYVGMRENKNKIGVVSENEYEFFDKKSSSKMIIARDNYVLQKWKKKLLDYGLAWHNPYRPEDAGLNMLKTVQIRPFLYLKRLHLENGELTRKEYKQLLNSISEEYINHKRVDKYFKECVTDVKRKFDKFHLFSMVYEGEFFNEEIRLIDKLKIKENIYNYLVPFINKNKKKYWERELSFVDCEKVILGTIHSVKGGEAEDVLIDCQLPKRIKNSIRESEALTREEARVFFVGMTRTKRNLYLTNLNELF